MNQFFSTMNGDLAPRLSNRTLNPDALRTFVAIYDTGTFRKAAERVHRSPSAVSLQVGKLEEVLEVQLLNRDARRVELTDHGERLLRYARRIISLHDEALASFLGSPLSGRLRLAAPQDLGVTLVPELLQRLAEIHPGVIVDVRLDTSEAVQHLFTSGAVNLALFNEAQAPPIPVQDLFSEPLVWLMSEGGRAIERDPLPLAVAEIGCAWREAALRSLEDIERPYRIAYSSDTAMGQVAAIRGDLAISALPRSLIGNGLVEVSEGHNLPPLPHTHVYLADDGKDLSQAFAAIVGPSLSDGNPDKR